MASITAHQVKIWQAFFNFCRNRGAFVTSTPHTSPMRIEVHPKSKLPDELVDFGHRVTACGEEKRMLPSIEEFEEHDRRQGAAPAVQHVTEQAVSIFEIELPEFKPREGVVWRRRWGNR